VNIVSSDALREGFLLPIAETRFKVWSRKIGEHMTTYRINTIDRDGRFSGTKAVECVDDEEAVAKGQAADGDDVLIWEHKRFVARLPGVPLKRSDYSR
jgi:hypothetical protein